MVNFYQKSYHGTYHGIYGITRFFVEQVKTFFNLMLFSHLLLETDSVNKNFTDSELNLVQI